MVPFHLLLVALVAPRPLVAVAVCGLSFAIPFCVDSMDSALEIVRQVPTIRFAVGLAISAGVVALTARMSRRTLLRASMPAPDRVRAVMTAALIYATATIWAANLLLQNGVPAPRYFIPASLPFLYLVAERVGALGVRATIGFGMVEGVSLLLLSFAPHGLEVLQVPVAAVVTLYALATIVQSIFGRRIGSLWPPATICVCVILVAVGDLILQSKRGPLQAVTLAEVERLVPRLYAAGYTYPELLASLQGPAADDMIALLTERDPKFFDQPTPHLAAADFSLLVVKVPNTALAGVQGVIATVPSDDSRSAIVVLGERPYLDWIRARRCTWTSDRGQAASYTCVQPRLDQPLPHNWPYVDFGGPVSPSESAPAPRASDGSVHFEVPVHTPGHGVAHIVSVANEWPATWTIVRVRDVQYEGELPGAEIRLPDKREATGVVEFEFRLATRTDLPWVWLPHAMEVTEGNECLLDAFRRMR